MPRPPKPKTFKTPRTMCPFSAEELQFVETSAGWQVRGAGWASTKLFQSREMAEWHFSHHEGNPPDFPSPTERLKVVGEVLPPTPDLMKPVDDAVKRSEQTAEEFERELRDGN